MHLYVYDCVIHWDVHVGNSGSRCCTHNFGTAGCRKNGLSEHCHGTSTKLVAKDPSPTDAEGATPCKPPRLDFTQTAGMLLMTCILCQLSSQLPIRQLKAPSHHDVLVNVL